MNRFPKADGSDFYIPANFIVQRSTLNALLCLLLKKPFCLIAIQRISI